MHMQMCNCMTTNSPTLKLEDNRRVGEGERERWRGEERRQGGHKEEKEGI